MRERYLLGQHPTSLHSTLLDSHRPSWSESALRPYAPRHFWTLEKHLETASRRPLPLLVLRLIVSCRSKTQRLRSFYEPRHRSVRCFALTSQSAIFPYNNRLDPTRVYPLCLVNQCNISTRAYLPLGIARTPQDG